MERRIWLASEKINLRGMPVDLDGLRHAQRLVDDITLQYAAEVQEITGGTLLNATNNHALCQWLSDVTGDNVLSVAKDKVTAMLEQEQRDDVRRVLEIRQIVGKSAVKKFKALEDRASADGRIRGSYIYCGAASTGRWASVGVNLQNMYRPTIKDPSTLADNLEHMTAADLSFLYGDPIGALCSCVRSMLCTSPDKRFVVADWSSIESRYTAYHAGEEWKLDVFTGDGLIYERSAADIYQVDYTDIADGSDERQAGKVVDLACLSGDTQILTRSGLARLDQLPPRSQVWDGVQWVTHRGVIERGTKNVIDYQGLTATPDHVVFLDSGETCDFITAARRGARIAVTGDGGQPLRLRGRYGASESLQDQLERAAPIRPVQPMPSNGVDRRAAVETGSSERLPSLLDGSANAALALEACDRREATLRQPKRSVLSKLRRAWNRFCLFLAVGYGVVGPEALGAATERQGLGSDRQQRGLRTGKFAVGDPQREQPEQSTGRSRTRELASDGMALQRVDRSAEAAAGAESRRDTDRSAGCGITEAEKLAWNFRETKVYDIAHAGPRNRFTANGRLVHNCGFGGGMGAVMTMAGSYGIDMDAIELTLPDEMRRQVSAVKIDVEDPEKFWWPNSITRGQAFAEFCKRRWREANPNTVSAWAAHQEAALRSIQNPGKAIRTDTATPCAYMTFKNGEYMLCKLPSGRTIPYVRPHIGEGKFGEEVRYSGLNSTTRQWVKKKTYGGDLFQSFVQGSCRDFLGRALVQLEDEEFHTVGHVHDEILVEQDVDDTVHSLDRLKEIMTTIPPWAPDFPIATDDGYGERRYKK